MFFRKFLQFLNPLIKKTLLSILILVSCLSILAMFGGFWNTLIDYTLYPKITRRQTSPPPILPFREFYSPTITIDITKKNTKEKLQNETNINSIKLHGWEYIVDIKKPFIIYAHGNGEPLKKLKEGNLPILLDIAKKTHSNFIVTNYPSYGNSEGIPNERSLVESVKFSIRRAKNYNKNASIYLIGYSLGGAVASLTAYEMKGFIDKLIIISTFGSLLEIAKDKIHFFYRLAEPFIKEQHAYDVVTALQKTEQKTLILHGEEDKIVNFHYGEKLYNKLSHKNEMVTFIAHKANHRNILNMAKGDIISFLLLD